MVFGRYQYKLPKFPQDVAPVFKRLCIPIEPEKIPEIKSDLDKCMVELREEAPSKPYLNLKLAAEIAERCHFLLDSYSNYALKQRGLIMGAVRYFAYDNDPFPDGTFATGLDDDATIVNYVLERLGVEDKFITIG